MIVGRKTLIKSIAFCVVLLLTFFAGCSSEVTQNTDGDTVRETSETYDDVIKVSVTVGEGYEISDEDELEATLVNEYTSTDTTVAVLRSGKYIMGLRQGQAYVTVSDDDGETVYDVTVAANEDIPEMSKLQTDGDVPENDIYLGCGYNALSGEEMNIVWMMKYSKMILDWEKLYKSGNIGMAGMDSTKNYAYTGTNMESFLKSYSKKSTVEVGAKLFGKEIYKNRKEFSIFNESSGSSVSSICQTYVQIQKACYYIEEDDDGYESYLLPEVKEKLMGTDEVHTSPEDFVKEYGTHILVSGIYGGSFEYNYSYSDSKYCILNTINPKSNIAHYIGQYDKFLSDYNTEYPRWVFDDYFEKNFKSFAMKKPELLGECLFKIITGRFKRDSQLYTELIGSDPGQETASLYIGGELTYFGEAWGDPLQFTLDHMDEWIFRSEDQLIGPKDKWSLYPVWDLIPMDTQEGKARKEEFVAYLKSMQ